MATGENKRGGRVGKRTGRGSRGSATRDKEGMAGSELRRLVLPVGEVLVLAAVERAERHRRRDGSGVMPREVFDHMGFLYNPAAVRQFRPTLDALMAAGVLGFASRHKVRLWVLTSAGRRRLEAAQETGEGSGLPESPQHRAWRHARTTAAEQVDGFREQVRSYTNEALKLLDAGEQPHSDAWFGLAERLGCACWQLGSATHCLREWVEPDDARIDSDERDDPGDDLLDAEERHHRRDLRHGRRNTWRWDSPLRARPR